MDKIKEQIIYKALDLFRRNGVKAVTMDDISKELGISKKTLYKQFCNKEEILLKCVKYRLHCEGIFDHQDTGLLDLLVDCHEHVASLSKRVERRGFWDISKYYTKVYLFLSARISNYAIIRKEKVQEGITQGYVRKDTSDNLVYVFLTGHLSKIFTENEYCTRNSQEDLLANAILVFARGISTIKGRSYIDKKLKKQNIE